MRLFQRVLVLPLVVVMAMSASAFADQHAVSAKAIAASVAEHMSRQDDDRASVREALARPEVLDVATRLGIDLDRVAATAETLNGSDLERAGAAARSMNGSLVGGASTITISTTTIIIALLILIVIIVAVK
jgi:hypothetical protein